jgi:hypothetical protein
MSKSKKSKVGWGPAELVELAADNPYIHRLIEDASIRENFARALDSGRRAIDRIGGAKNPAKAMLDDKRVQTELRTAVEALRDATVSLTEAPKKAAKAKSKRLGRKLLLLGAGATTALVVSEDLRTKVLDALFGAEEEFQYTPPAGAPSPPPSPVSAA